MTPEGLCTKCSATQYCEEHAPTSDPSGTPATGRPDALSSLKELYAIVLDGMQGDYDDMTAALGRARRAIEAAASPPDATGRPEQHLIDLAIQVSGWSPCRSKRGSVIFVGENVIAHGHNYKPHPFACDGSAACKATCRIEAVHAEQRALLDAGRSARGAEMLHVKSVDGKLVPSGGPSCAQCSKLALAAGVTAMWLYHEAGWKRYETAEWHRLSLLASDPSGTLATGRPEAALATLTERAAWYRDGCPFLEDRDSYYASGDCALDAASDLEAALNEIRVLELVIAKFRQGAKHDGS